MKSRARVDIFRPLAAAKRGCRQAESATSIFRRRNNNSNSNQNQQPSHHPAKSNSSEDETYVVSVQPGQWPPHQQAVSRSSGSDGASTAQHKHLDRSAPLPTGSSTSTFDRSSSPQSAARSKSSQSSQSSKSKKTPPPPSYYKIELVQDGDDMVQLTAGDDSSVQLTPDHNEQLIQLANVVDVNKKNNIIRASPIVEHEAIELDHEAHSVNVIRANGAAICASSLQQHDPSQRWTISDNGDIIVIPPSPSRVSMTHSKKPSKTDHGHDEASSSLSMPPSLVKANSSSDSSSSSDNDSLLSATNDSIAKECPPSGSESLESPPRMTRSVITPSLFQESIEGSSKGGSTSTISANGSKSRSNKLQSNKKGRQTPTTSQRSSGCGTRFDFLSQILDVFSLNGACCHQGVNCS